MVVDSIVSYQSKAKATAPSATAGGGGGGPAVWEFDSGAGVWQAMAPDLSAHLSQRLSLGQHLAKFNLHGTLYLYDLVAMEQTNATTGVVRAIRCVGTASTGPSAVSAAGAGTLLASGCSFHHQPCVAAFVIVTVVLMTVPAIASAAPTVKTALGGGATPVSCIVVHFAALCRRGGFC